MIKKNLLILALALLTGTMQALAQAKVKSMRETTDFIPADDQRRDFNKQLCALVKVQVIDDITDIEGNIMGDIVDKGVEKWVYMAQGSRNMKIHLKNNLPIRVMFRDYKINGLKSNRIYELVIDVPNAPQKKTSNTAQGRLRMFVQPASATVEIWNNAGRKVYKPDANGDIKLRMPYGRYYYKAKANGYIEQENSFFVNDEITRETVVLQRPVGWLTLKCASKNVNFRFGVDNDSVVSGTIKKGAWMFELPAGRHMVTLSAKGYVSQTINVNVEAGSNQNVTFPALVSEKKQAKAKKKKDNEVKRKKRAERAKELEAAAKIRSMEKEAQLQKKYEERQKKPVLIGVAAGYNMASAGFNDDEATVESLDGFHLGVTFDFRLAQNFYFSTGLLVSKKGYKYEGDYYSRHEDIEEKGEATYIDLPLLLTFQIPLSARTKLELNAGPYTAFCVDGKVADHYSWNSLYDESFSSAYSGFDYGLQAGAALLLGSHFKIGASYQLGLEKSYPNRNLMIGAGFRF